MKTLLTFLLAIVVFTAFAQDTTFTLPGSGYRYHGTDNSKAWAIITSDTLHAASNDDTIVINIPQKFGSFYVGILETTMDTLALTADLEGTYEIRTAQCETCPYTTIETVTIPNVDVYTRDTIELYEIRAQIRMIGTSGDGVLSSWLTLKPIGFRGSW